MCVRVGSAVETKASVAQPNGDFFLPHRTVLEDCSGRESNSPSLSPASTQALSSLWLCHPLGQKRGILKVAPQLSLKIEIKNFLILFLPTFQWRDPSYVI